VTARAQYEHTQAGWPMRIAFALGALLLLVVTLLPEMQRSPAPVPVLLGGAAVMLALGWLWSSLTVRIAEGALQLRFGLGFPRKSVPLADIAAVEVTRTGFWDGWGLHRTRRGWLYNVSGLDAVLVHRKDGKSFLVGSDEPRRLKAALERAMTAGQRG
jgi:hypothetical protein